MNYIYEDSVKKIIPSNSLYQHKGNCGKVLICGGSKGFTGAVCMSANAALRTGSGLVTVAVPDSLNNIYEIKLTEAMSLPLEDENGYFTKNSYKKALDFALTCDAVAIGPGGGESFGYVAEKFILDCPKPMVIDADAINYLSQNTDLLFKKKAPVILTPHVGEMSRLTGRPIEQINSDRVNTAEEFSKKYNVITVLKGFNTVITDGVNTFINTTGNEGMATGGAGDVLTGMILSLLGRKVNPVNSAILGTYLHGLAGDFAKSKFNAYSMTATDIIENIYEAINKLSEGDSNDRKIKDLV